MVLFENVKKTPFSNDEELIDFVKALKAKNNNANKKQIKRGSQIRLPSEIEIFDMFERAQGDESNASVKCGIDLLMRQIGYFSHQLLLDTKHYYLPQTRQRRYMLCVERSYFGELQAAETYENEDRNRNVEVVKRTLSGATKPSAGWPAVKRELNKWVAMVLGLKHTKFVPAEAMLLAASEESKSLLQLSEDPGGEKDWRMCKERHDRYRDKQQLEDKRKLTSWRESGGRCLPDFWTTTKSMTNRVLDFLETRHLQRIRDGVDDRYYRYVPSFLDTFSWLILHHRLVIELSQNVDRGDGMKTGIVDCILPSGMKLWTSKGRMIGGKEALLLQGLPINRMDLSHLIEPYLYTLAGNAMSSTVVGATLLAALTTFSGALGGPLGNDSTQEARRQPRLLSLKTRTNSKN